MNHPILNLAILVGIGALVAGISLAVRRRLGGADVDTSPWAATLSYVATALGIVLGFSIIFLFGEFSDARSAVGDEATAIGTAYEEAGRFPTAGPPVQRALVCYGRAVPRYDWPAMRDGGGAPEVDRAYAALVASLGSPDEPAAGALHAATATNLVAQIGDISTARETRLVAAQTAVPPMLWGLLIGGGLFVLGLVFVVTLPAGPRTQAALVGLSAMFTVVMILLVVALSSPFAQGSGRVTPKLIQETVASLDHRPPVQCNFEEAP